MREDWDFYPLLVDSEPASIYLDLGVAQAAPVRAQPHMAYVRVLMRQPRHDGLSSNEEFEALSALEDALIKSAVQNGITKYVGRNTSGGNRDFYFYTADPEAFADSINAAMIPGLGYQFEIGARLDPDWQTYFNFLYPSADDLQRILNRRVTDNLTGHGDTLSEPRPIDHLAYLPTTDAAACLRNYLGEQGFIVDAPKIEGGSVALSFKRTDRPDGIDEVVIPIARRVQELGGEYDGWGCEVVG